MTNASAVDTLVRALRRVRGDLTLTNARTFAEAFATAPDGVYATKPLTYLPREGEPARSAHTRAEPTTPTADPIVGAREAELEERRRLIVRNRAWPSLISGQLLNLLDVARSAPGRAPRRILFEGLQGVGKSTAAEEIAHIYVAAGILTNPTVIEISAASLRPTGQDGRWATKNIRPTLQNAHGYLLHIDADDLWQNPTVSAAEAAEVITTLLTEAADDPQSVVVLTCAPATSRALSRDRIGLPSYVEQKWSFPIPTSADIGVMASKVFSDHGILIPATTYSGLVEHLATLSPDTRAQLGHLDFGCRIGIEAYDTWAAGTNGQPIVADQPPITAELLIAAARTVAARGRS